MHKHSLLTLQGQALNLLLPEKLILIVLLEILNIRKPEKHLLNSEMIFLFFPWKYSATNI